LFLRKKNQKNLRDAGGSAPKPPYWSQILSLL